MQPSDSPRSSREAPPTEYVGSTRNFLLDVAEHYWNHAREVRQDRMVNPEVQDVLVNSYSRSGNRARDLALTFPVENPNV